MVVDLVWGWYLLTVSLLALAYGWGGGSGQPLLYALLHLGLFAVMLFIRARTATASPYDRRYYRGAFALFAVPLVFSAMGLVLPALHPEPWEWTWMAWDRALLGSDPTVAAGGWLTPAWTELLQWVYTSFYAIPIVTIATLGWRRGGDEFDRALITVTFCFLVTYLGYFLWPTLPPYLFLPHDGALEGTFMAGSLIKVLEWLEVHRWNCFPSGHTMLSVVCLVLAVRVRVLFWILMPVVSLMLVSTVALRYHYVQDVIAGVVLAWPAYRVAGLIHRWGAEAEK